MKHYKVPGEGYSGLPLGGTLGEKQVSVPLQHGEKNQGAGEAPLS